MDGPTLTIRIEPSRRLRAVLVLLHLAAALAPWGSSLPVLPCSIASLFALASLAAILREHVRLSTGCRIGLTGGAWWLEEGGHRWPATLLPDTVVAEHLLVLRLRGVGGVRSLVLLGDCCSAEDLRRLRVVLRTAGCLSHAPRA